MKVTGGMMNLLRNDINEALREVAARRGVTLKVGSGSYDMNEQYGSFKLEVGAVNSATGEVATKDSESFKRYAASYGLAPDDLNREFRHGMDTFKITGLNTRRPKNPISAIRVRDGAGFKFTANAVCNALGKPQAAPFGLRNSFNFG